MRFSAVLHSSGYVVIRSSSSTTRILASGLIYCCCVARVHNLELDRERIQLVIILPN